MTAKGRSMSLVVACIGLVLIALAGSVIISSILGRVDARRRERDYLNYLESQFSEQEVEDD